MEGLLKLVRKDTKPGASLSDNSYNLSEKVGLTAALSPPDQSHCVILHLIAGKWFLCGLLKMCAIFFVAGIVVGYTLKKRVRRWLQASSELKDD
uniref:Uncharacterized protein n=1 Tax=Salix viminalis TaxID=40686 RepID=A0A6N2LM85_SALVM